MKKLLTKFENWLPKNFLGVVIFILLISFYVVLTHLPYINVFLLAEVPFELFISICLLFVFKPSFLLTILFGLSILSIAAVLAIIGFVDYYDSFGNIIFVIVVYLLTISIMHKGER